MGKYVGNNILVSNEITIFNPSAEQVRRIEDELFIVNPEYTRRSRLGLWMGNISKYYLLYRIDGDKIIIPTGAGSILRGTFKPTDIAIDLADNGVIDYKADIPLYDYQKDAVEAITKVSNGILVAPCGSGKTQMGIALISRLGRKALWLTHTKDLLKQSYDRAKQYIPEDMLGTITDGKINIANGITFATVQTMSKQDMSMYKYSFDVIVVDECHRASGSMSKVGMFSKVLSGVAARYKYGLSATVHRADGLIKSTYALIGNVAYTVPEQAVADKTCRVVVKRIQTGIEESEDYLGTDGMLEYLELVNWLTHNDKRNNVIAGKIVEDAEHSQIVLSDRIEHLEILKDKLVEYGMPEESIRMINGKMTSKKAKAERENAIQDMREGRAKCLLATYSLAKEGLDIPRLDRLHMALPKKDYAVVIQCIGRISRTAEGKNSAICYDYVDNIAYCQKVFTTRKRFYKKKGCNIQDERTYSESD